MNAIEELEFHLDLETAIEQLSVREASVLKMRYGLNDGEPKTLREIAKVHGVSTERVKVVLAKIEAKLYHPANPMSEYLTLKGIEYRDWASEVKEWEIEEAKEKAIKERERKESQLNYAKRDLLALENKVKRLEAELNG